MYIDGSYTLCNYEAIFSQSLVNFNPLLPTFSKALYTTAAKFPASPSEHITSGARKLKTNCDSACVDFALTET
jgi:hypothetical protein